MKAFSRWQDWTVIAIGVLVAITPFVFGEASAYGVYSAVGLGVLIALAGLWMAFLEKPGFVAWFAPILGVILFFTPWLFGFTDQAYAMWAAFIGGALAVVVGGYELVSAPASSGRPVTT